MTGPTMSQLIRDACGRRDPELDQQPVEHWGSIGGGRGGTASNRPMRRSAGDRFNEEVRVALAAKRGLIRTSDFFP
jgi:hypothetical protein